ncbi:MAG TPA: ABC transporter C-terminal domain-containing protein, partial [Bacteroidia bacterium]|nr:ABC transporter C-terminal domain-containing protein [Bacteroidia bacterium]
VKKGDESSVAENIPAATVSKKKLSFKEKSEFDQLEKDIEKLEKEKVLLTEKLSSAGQNQDDVLKWSERIGQVMAELDEKSQRWLELSE